MAERGFDDVGLESKIVVNEIGRVGGIGEDAPDLSGGEEDIFWLFFREEAVDGLRITEVEFGAGAKKEIGIAKRLQVARDGGTNKATVAGDENARAI